MRYFGLCPEWKEKLSFMNFFKALSVHCEIYLVSLNIMKSIIPFLLLAIFVSQINAKMSSTVEVSNIQDIKIEDGKIIIIGDGVFHSRMVTTEEKKDSAFVISGQPSSSYTARGRAVKFSITSHRVIYDRLLAQHPEQKLSKEDKLKWDKRLILWNDVWGKTQLAAKNLKKGGTVNLVIQGSDVTFKEGELISVKGPGQIITNMSKESQ